MVEFHDVDITKTMIKVFDPRLVAPRPGKPMPKPEDEIPTYVFYRQACEGYPGFYYRQKVGS